MEYKDYTIKMQFEFYSNEHSVGVFKGDKLIYESEPWHEKADPDFERADAFIEKVKRMIDDGEIE